MFFFLQLRLQGNGRPRATLCMLRIVVFFFTEVSQMKERNLVNSVHDDMLMTFPLDFSEFFFQLGLRGNGRLQATLCRL